MLLDDRGPESDARHRDADAERMIGKPDLAAKEIAHMRDRGEFVLSGVAG